MGAQCSSCGKKDIVLHLTEENRYGAPGSSKSKADPYAAQREAEAARLLQRVAAAHLALAAEPIKPPGLNIPTLSGAEYNNPNDLVSNVVETARGLVEGTNLALRKGLANLGMGDDGHELNDYEEPQNRR